MPSATLATITVAMLSEMPSHPMHAEHDNDREGVGDDAEQAEAAPIGTRRRSRAKTVRNAVAKLLSCETTR